MNLDEESITKGSDKGSAVENGNNDNGDIGSGDVTTGEDSSQITIGKHYKSFSYWNKEWMENGHFFLSSVILTSFE